MRRAVSVVLGFVALTVVITYPQVAGFTSAVPDHSDPYFSMWRLGWVAHAIAHDVRALFDANIFFPEKYTLAYSDAMLLPGVVLAPLFWVDVSPVIIYNSALFAAFALSGVSTFVLARELTGDTASSAIAGLIFAFAPYRFTHYAHLELQLVFWMPLALLLVHRISANGGIRVGVQLGLAVGAQLLSCIYGAIFLTTYLLVFVPALLVDARRRNIGKTISALIVACGVSMAIAVPYAVAYKRAATVVGTRSASELGLYSATARNYMAAPAMNRLYGRTAIADAALVDEMNLFPGVVAVCLSLVGVVCGKGRARFAYLAGLLLSIDVAAGANGFLYPMLFEHVGVFRALRSVARIDILTTLSLAVLSAYGATFLLGTIRRRHVRQALAAAIGLVLVAEYASAPSIAPAPSPSKVDALLARKPPSVVVELPLLSRRATWGSLDYQYMYQSTPHFQRMLNGYSGYVPPSYYAMRQALSSFPDDASMKFLRDRRVDYVVVRSGLYEGSEGIELTHRIAQRRDLVLEASWTGGRDGTESLYLITNLQNK
jgi:hypothetical protein